MNFIESHPSGMSYKTRIHAMGCRDLIREKRQGYEQHPAESDTWKGWVTSVFGDIASDYEEPGTEAWVRECESEARECKVMKCAKDAGFK